MTACPGSGKTRVLTERVMRELERLASRHQRIVAVTFTNRAADEISSRLLEVGEERRRVWTGTIHAFALEWILRPYAGYSDALRNGFSVADEYCTRREIDELRGKYSIDRFATVQTAIDRNGRSAATSANERALVDEFRSNLRLKRLIDFDMVLFLAYQVLRCRPEIPRTLSAIMRMIAVDEYQDTQDLQYGILSAIVRASAGATDVFIVGDINQAIYTSLGGVAKTLEEIK